ncbi:MAG: S8 family serine peptidase, partial [candidate division Zixibacteria bacterium]|nr:S8 family serine peptidase [candidate division Zixibacteria bacterium]
MKPGLNHEGYGLKKTLAGIAIAMGVLLLTTVSTFSQDYPPGKLWVTFYPGAFDSLETDTNGNMVYRLSYLDSVNIANECSTIVSDSVAGLDSSKLDYMVYFPENSDLLEIADAYLDDPNVRFARPDYFIEFLYTPNDTLFDRQGNSMECHQWGLDNNHCQFEKAWDITKGDTSVVIAMIDYGIFYSHPELKDKLWINGPEDANGNGTFEPWRSDSSVPGDFDGEDDDGNRFIDDVVGWNFLDGDSTPYIDSVDQPHHGTITSSIAAGMTDNGVGIAGAAPNCRLMLLTGIPGAGTNSWALKCLRYASLMRPDVINMSWYTPPSPENPTGNDPAISSQIGYLSAIGVVLVAAGAERGVRFCRRHQNREFGQTARLRSTELRFG